MSDARRRTSLAARVPFATSLGWAGGVVVVVMLLSCLLTLPYTMGGAARRGAAGPSGSPAIAPPRYQATNLDEALLPPIWAPHAPDEQSRLNDAAATRGARPRHLLGTDRLGRDLFIRLLAGGGISLSIGLAAAAVAVCIGVLYGTAAGACGGRIDAVLMRLVDILYGLPTILLVVLLAVAADGLMDRAQAAVTASRSGLAEGSSAGGWWAWLAGHRGLVNVLTLLLAIGGVSWLTMARVIRGQVLSLKQQPFMEAARAMGAGLPRQFLRHLLPNLLGPITVYATLAVPAAILSESFLSFLGIGVREPLPSWGNLAADGLSELNLVRSRWWLLLWPCLLIGLTLVALNLFGEWLRERLDPTGRTRA